MLSAKIMEPECRCGCCCDLSEVPEPLSCLFGDDIILDTGVKKLFVTLGQFSIIRLERDIQLQSLAGIRHLHACQGLQLLRRMLQAGGPVRDVQPI